MPTPSDPPYDPCHLWQDAVESGVAMLEQGTALIEANMPQLIQCRLDNPGSGPVPIPQAPMAPQMQKGIRQISESEIQSETEDQRTVRMALETIRRQLEIVRRTTKNNE